MPAPDPAQTAPTIPEVPAEYASAPVASASEYVGHLGALLDDARVAAEFGRLSGRTMEQVGYARTAGVEAWASVRPSGGSEMMPVRVMRPEIAHVEEQVRAAGGAGPVEIVWLHVRRFGTK
ncbi:MAG: hypothetical protein ACAI43_23075 [Phycisphaerae bacterium]|nr:hypothetical protein [Tepidisphaeraceae bacterium]